MPLTNSDRQERYRIKQYQQGRKGRLYYLTDLEKAVIDERLREMRAASAMFEDKTND